MQDNEFNLNLPPLKRKQNDFVMRYAVNGGNEFEAYKYSYDCANMKDESIRVEASRLLKNPNITPWIDYYRQMAQKACEEEFKYTVIDAMKEYTELQTEAMKSYKTYNVAKGCIDGKCRINGLGEDKKATAKIVVNMENVTKNGKELEFNCGDTITENT